MNKLIWSLQNIALTKKQEQVKLNIDNNILDVTPLGHSTNGIDSKKRKGKGKCVDAGQATGLVTESDKYVDPAAMAPTTGKCDILYIWS